MIIAHGNVRKHFENRRPSKYRNQVIHVDGHTFQSMKESRRYTELRMKERAGLITDLQVHPVFDIMVKDQKVCSYIGDFKYLVQARKVIPEGEMVSYVQKNDMLFEMIVEDTKGIDPKTGWDTRTPTYRLKVKLLKATRGIVVKEI